MNDIRVKVITGLLPLDFEHKINDFLQYFEEYEDCGHTYIKSHEIVNISFASGGGLTAFIQYREHIKRKLEKEEKTYVETTINE